MLGRGRVRPSKPVSLVVMVIGIVFVGLGVFVFIPEAGVFGVLWTLFAGAVTAYHAVNVFSERGVAAGVVDFDMDARSDTKESDVEERLRKLEALKRKGLVTDEEYQHQRERILEEL